MDIYNMSNGLTFELNNIFLRNSQDRCQMIEKWGLQNFMKIGPSSTVGQTIINGVFKGK